MLHSRSSRTTRHWNCTVRRCTRILLSMLRLESLCNSTSTLTPIFDVMSMFTFQDSKQYVHRWNSIYSMDGIQIFFTGQFSPVRCLGLGWCCQATALTSRPSLQDSRLKLPGKGHGTSMILQNGFFVALVNVLQSVHEDVSTSFNFIRDNVDCLLRPTLSKPRWLKKHWAAMKRLKAPGHDRNL